MIKHIVALSSANGAIGLYNKLPWHIPEDLKHFQELTMGKTIYMGRNTFKSILPYVKEAFLLAPYQKALVEEGLISSPEEFQTTWFANVKAILDEATIEADVENAFVQKGGKEGVHTEHLGFILTDLQYLQRTYPNSQW